MSKPYVNLCCLDTGWLHFQAKSKSWYAIPCNCSLGGKASGENIGTEYKYKQELMRKNAIRAKNTKHLTSPVEINMAKTMLSDIKKILNGSITLLDFNKRYSLGRRETNINIPDLDEVPF